MYQCEIMMEVILVFVILSCNTHNYIRISILFCLLFVCLLSRNCNGEYFLSNYGNQIYCSPVLQSDTASLAVPELDFSVESGTLGGCFTTVEGLLVQARDQLKGAQPFTDSLEESKNEKFGKFIEKLDEVCMCVHAIIIYLLVN